MSKVVTRAASPARRFVVWDAVTTLVVAAVVVVLVVPRLADETRVDVTFVNETDWTIAVELVLENGSILPLAHVARRSELTVHEIFEPGRIWRFRMRFAGEELTVIEVDDTSLRADEYTVAVPDEIADELRRRGASPTP